MSFKILMATLVVATVITATGITILARRAEAVEGIGRPPIDFDPAAKWSR